MLHMVTCPNRELRAYWNRVNDFRIAVLGGSLAEWSFPETVIFGVDRNYKIISETTRAWLRHAVRWWYAAMTHIDKQGGLFSAAETLERALHGFRGAVIRWAVSIRMHYIARKYTKRVGVVTNSERAKFNTY